MKACSATTVRKVSLSLPEGLVDDLDHIASVMKISRSAVCSEILAGPLHDFRAIVSTALNEIASGSDPDAVKARARGSSLGLINRRFADLKEAGL